MVSDASLFLIIMAAGAVIGAVGVWAAISGRKESEQRRARAHGRQP